MAIGVLNGNWRGAEMRSEFSAKAKVVNVNAEQAAMQRGIEVMGFDAFDAWYSGDDVPQFGTVASRVALIDAKIAVLAEPCDMSDTPTPGAVTK